MLYFFSLQILHERSTQVRCNYNSQESGRSILCSRLIFYSGNAWGSWVWTLSQMLEVKQSVLIEWREKCNNRWMALNGLSFCELGNTSRHVCKVPYHFLSNELLEKYLISHSTFSDICRPTLKMKKPPWKNML